MSRSADLPSVPARTLNDGTSLPELGFGTANLKGEVGTEAIRSAVDSGYRLLDSAYNYENEGALGAAIARSSTPREDLRVTSKLPGRYHEYDDAVVAVQESLFRANLEYFDLYLIHWPNPKQGRFVEAWSALVDMQKKGLLKSIGVSNFLPEHITQLTEQTGVTPSVNQLEIHPWFPQEEALRWNREQGIAVEAWSPVGRNSDLQHSPVISEIAQETGRSPVQVILRWHIERGTLPLPRSSNAGRQRENLDVFDFSLSAEHIERLASLARAEGRLQGQDPAEYEEF